MVCPEVGRALDLSIDIVGHRHLANGQRGVCRSDHHNVSVVRRNNLLGRISRKANQVDARATGKQRGARNCHNRPDLALARRDRGDDRLRDVRPAGHKLK